MEVNDAEGKRQLKLSFIKTLAEPRKMIISCSNNNEFENIFEAEVVFCYGDRNNEYLQKQQDSSVKVNLNLSTLIDGFNIIKILEGKGKGKEIDTVSKISKIQKKSECETWSCFGLITI